MRLNSSTAKILRVCPDLLDQILDSLDGIEAQETEGGQLSLGEIDNFFIASLRIHCDRGRVFHEKSIGS